MKIYTVALAPITDSATDEHFAQARYGVQAFYDPEGGYGAHIYKVDAPHRRE